MSSDLPPDSYLRACQRLVLHGREPALLTLLEPEQPTNVVSLALARTLRCIAICRARGDFA
jgi:hypothetical protein